MQTISIDLIVPQGWHELSDTNITTLPFSFNVSLVSHILGAFRLVAQPLWPPIIPS